MPAQSAARDDELAPGLVRPVRGLSPILVLLLSNIMRLLRGKSELVFKRSKLEVIRGDDCPTPLPEVASVVGTPPAQAP